MPRKLKLPLLIAAALSLIYAVIGFLVVPAIARSQAVDLLRENYGLDLEIGKLRFNPFTFAARLERVSLSDPAGGRLLAFDAFAADFELRSLIDRALVFKSVALERPYVHVHLREDGTLNLAQAFASASSGESPAGEPAPAPPAVVIGDIVLSGGDVHFTDNSQDRDFDEHFTPLDLHVQHFSTRPEDRSDLVGLDISIGGSGRLTVSGDLSAIPTRFDIRLAARDIPLATFQPYLEDRLPARISAGALAFDLTLAQGQPDQSAQLRIAGNTAITGLAVRLRERDDVVLAWEEVAANGVTLDLSPDRLVIDEIAIRGLDTSFKIYADGRTNVSEIARQARGESPEAAKAEAPEKPAEPDAPASGFSYAIDRVVVAGSRLMFSDEQIQPNVRVRIEDLFGEIGGITSAPEVETTVALAGRIGEYGKAKIDGAARLAAPERDLKTKVAFGNVELTSFSPYAGKFAGYTIDKGKLFLDLNYTLIGSRIRGENHAVFDQFELGDRVDSADALKLPIKFALSLLRDREGRIDIDLPVEGDVDAPGFKPGPLVVKALVNLLTRIVTAPFDFIAGMFGGGPEMEYAVFAPGDGVLPGAEREKILPLSQALAERPRLVVEIQGWADPGADADALRQGKFDALLAATGAPADSALVAAYEGFFGAGAAAALRTELAAGARSDPAAEHAEGTPAIDPEAAFRAELSDRLLAAQPVTDEELSALAYVRGEQVMGLLVQDGGVEAERVFVRRGEIARAGEGTKAKLILDAR